MCTKEKVRGKTAWSSHCWHCVYTGHKYWFFHRNVGMWIKSFCHIYSFVFGHLLFSSWNRAIAKAQRTHTHAQYILTHACHTYVMCTHRSHHYRILLQWNFISWYFIFSFVRALSFCVSVRCSFFSWRLGGYHPAAAIVVAGAAAAAVDGSVMSINLITWIQLNPTANVFFSSFFHLLQTAHTTEQKSHKYTHIYLKWNGRVEMCLWLSVFVEPIKLSSTLFSLQR